MIRAMFRRLADWLGGYTELESLTEEDCKERLRDKAWRRAQGLSAEISPLRPPQSGNGLAGPSAGGRGAT